MTAELICLALAVYFEARSEPIQGQAAVAQVILNRVENPNYPGTICEVVTDGGTRRYRCQFSYWCDGKDEVPGNRAAWRRAQVVAKLVDVGTLNPPVGNATHYHASYASPYWRQHLKYVATIGMHWFYSEQS